MHQLELKDFLEYKFLSNVKMSPDKTSCVFTVSTCDEGINAYQSFFNFDLISIFDYFISLL